MKVQKNGQTANRMAGIYKSWIGSFCLSLAVVVTAGCSTDPAHFGLTRAQIEERTPFVAVPASQAWVSPPHIRSVLQRDLGSESEQQIGLANASAVSGDNVMLLRARAGSSNLGRLRFEDVVARFGGLPHPFTQLSSGDLLQEQDEIGSYFWAGQTIGDSTNCVLGLRRVDGGMRQLPGGAGVMDIILRNCVNGSQQEALAPLRAESIGTVAALRDSNGSSRMLSPLAAPTGDLRPVNSSFGTSQ